MASYAYSRFTAAPAASANRFVTSTNMINGAYSLAATTMPTDGARKVTITHTAVTGVDTLGTITIVGTNLVGQALTEVITPLNGTTATGTKLFKTISSATGAGWTISGGNDTITIGCDAVAYLSEGGVLHGVIVNTTAASTVTLADTKGTIAVLKASIAEGTYGPWDVNVSGNLTYAAGGASDVTVLYSAGSSAAT